MGKKKRRKQRRAPSEIQVAALPASADLRRLKTLARLFRRLADELAATCDEIAR